MDKNSFTLIEVLIALTIIAIALCAMTFTWHQSIQSTEHAKQYFIAETIATNVLTKAQLGLLSFSQNSNSIEGKSRQSTQTAHWEITRFIHINMPYQQVLVTVTMTPHFTYHLHGFIQQ